MRIRSFLLSPFPSLSVYLPLGSTSILVAAAVHTINFVVPRPPALAFDHQEKTSLSPMIPSIALAR